MEHGRDTVLCAQSHPSQDMAPTLQSGPEAAQPPRGSVEETKVPFQTFTLCDFIFVCVTPLFPLTCFYPFICSKLYLYNNHGNVP